MDYKKELNPEQYDAVTTKDGPILILAGAGSGKTRVITYRIAYMVENYNISPYNILAITFTNKAANEMKTRVEEMLGEESRGIWISTFHRFCGKILRAYAERVGYSSNFLIYDDDDTLKTVKEIMKRRNIDSKTAGAFKSKISALKNDMITPEDCGAVINKSNPNEKMLAAIYSDYQAELKKNNAMDFDDMLLNGVKLLSENEDVRRTYSERFRYIMVDEYQDTNTAQYKLISLLATHGNLCVVGDDDQSIYSFRGADIRNILDFEKQFRNCKIIKLEQNYRSTSSILNGANGVIANNKNRKSKKLWTAKEGGEKIFRFIGETQNEECSFIASEIRRLVGKNEYNYSDIAVLYRQNALSQSVEGTFARMSVPCRVYGGLRFFDRKEIKLIINYLRLFENPGDTAAFRAVINVPKRAIGDKGVEQVLNIAEHEHTTPMKITARAKKYTELTRYAAAMTEFATVYYKLLMERNDMTISEFIEHMINELGLVAMYKESKEEGDEDRIDNMLEFISVAQEFEKAAQEETEVENTFAGFLENITLSTDMDKENPEDKNKVTLMTVHSSKGLEFPVVFVVGMEQEIFPSARAIYENADGVSEERRLCYVAITRARERLYLTNARERLLYGKTNYNLESQFLGEIPDECVAYLNYNGAQGKAPGKSFGNFWDDNDGSYGSGNSYGSRGGYGSYGGSSGYGRGSYSGGNHNGGYGRNYNGGNYNGGNYNGGYGGNSYNGGYGGAYGSKSAPKAKPSGDFVPVESGGTYTPKTSYNGAGSSSATSSPKAVVDLALGDKVRHSRYGEGEVTAIEGEKTSEKDSRICEITFKNAGMKRFAMAFIKLEKLD